MRSFPFISNDTFAACSILIFQNGFLLEGCKVCWSLQLFNKDYVKTIHQPWHSITVNKTDVLPAMSP